MGYFENLLSQGWRYDANANRTGGLVRPDTRWNAQTGRFDTPNNVGGTVFVPQRRASGTAGAASTATPAAGVSSVVAAAPTVSFSGVSAPASVRAKGVTATLANWVAPEWSMADFGSSTVSAQRTDPFGVADPEILQELDRQAQAELALGGKLSDQEQRDAVQGARAALSDRGMLMSTPAAVAEVLARDKFARERQDSRRAFAQGVSGMLSDLDKFNAAAAQEASITNAERALRAGIANQGAGLSRWQTTAELGNRTALRNADALDAIAVGNADRILRADQGNQSAAMQAAQANAAGQMQAAIANQGAAGDAARLSAEDAWRRMADATERYGVSASLQRAASSQYTGPVGGYGTRSAGNSGTSWSGLMGLAGLPADTRPYTPLGGQRMLYSRSTGQAVPYAQGVSRILGGR